MQYIVSGRVCKDVTTVRKKHCKIEKEDSIMSEIKKNNVPQEINEEELDFVAGGAYTLEEWKALTPEERVAAQQRSRIARYQGRECELD